jgi:hypothetical protein
MCDNADNLLYRPGIGRRQDYCFDNVLDQHLDHETGNLSLPSI